MNICRTQVRTAYTSAMDSGTLPLVPLRFPFSESVKLHRTDAALKVFCWQQGHQLVSVPKEESQTKRQAQLSELAAVLTRNAVVVQKQMQT